MMDYSRFDTAHECDRQQTDRSTDRRTDIIASLRSD